MALHIYSACCQNRHIDGGRAMTSQGFSEDKKSTFQDEREVGLRLAVSQNSDNQQVLVHWKLQLGHLLSNLTSKHPMVFLVPNVFQNRKARFMFIPSQMPTVFPKSMRYSSPGPDSYSWPLRKINYRTISFIMHLQFHCLFSANLIHTV